MPARFRDRRAAGRALAAALEPHLKSDCVVLALPRGGVPVAVEIAMRLGAPLDLQLVRKIGAPGNRELAIGAVADGEETVMLMNEALMQSVAPPPDYVAAEIARELAEMTRRRDRYLRGRTRAPVEGRTAIVVDDGVATGATARAALAAVRGRGAARLVFAAPVAAAQSLPLLRAEADEVVCLLVPAGMMAVGSYYEDFRPTSDQEVIDLLAGWSVGLSADGAASMGQMPD